MTREREEQGTRGERRGDDPPEGALQEHHGHLLPPGEQPRWLDYPANVRKVIHAFWATCALLLAVDLLDLLGGGYEKHAHFHWEGWFGFYAFYGFVACFALVLLAKQLRKLVMRGEDYYES